MAQPGEDSGVELPKKSALENKWKASTSRLYNVINCIGTFDPSPCAVTCISEQLDQAKKYMDYVFYERTAILAPAEQDELIEEFNKLEKVYNEARSGLCNVKSGRIRAGLPQFSLVEYKSIFTFFLAVSGSVPPEKVVENHVQRLLGFSLDLKEDVVSPDDKDYIASDAALEMLEMKRMPPTLLLERFRRCNFVLSVTGRDRDWKFLILSIIRKCLDAGMRKDAEERQLIQVISSLAAFEQFR